jgi:hypothetical protein
MRACARLAGESRIFSLPEVKSQPFERRKSQIPSPSLCKVVFAVTDVTRSRFESPGCTRHRRRKEEIWKLVCKSHPSSRNTSSSLFARRPTACPVPSRGTVRGGEMCAYSYSLFRGLCSRGPIPVDHRHARGPRHGLFARAPRKYSRRGKCTHKSTPSFPRRAFRYVPERR